ncbi:helix-turn-helix domain-containing protein [Oricola sp.]|uniref:helix-turn-helix domain-containing protein n=1 Tax=Oricola sp. TaxID=1979950 RepID=UPI0025CE672D|nr:helix-turn-helix domain-containing protein [Oricola sp.]MCI5075669.1 helix-turn-helix domain-containing protein [Oricola sp.]
MLPIVKRTFTRSCLEFPALMLVLVENARRKQLAWVNAILDHRKWRPTNLAREAGIDHSTLSKWLKDPQNVAQLSPLTIEKIARVGGIPPYETAPVRKPAGLAEAEADPFDLSDLPPSSSRVIADLRGVIGQRNGIDPWVMRSRALEHEGYMPGDILLVDLNATPIDGDAVCAQVYDRVGKAETVMRIYEQPYLVAASSAPDLRRPLLVDNERVVIRGVIVASLRDRRVA